MTTDKQIKLTKHQHEVLARAASQAMLRAVRDIPAATGAALVKKGLMTRHFIVDGYGKPMEFAITPAGREWLAVAQSTRAAQIDHAIAVIDSSAEPLTTLTTDAPSRPEIFNAYGIERRYFVNFHSAYGLIAETDWLELRWQMRDQLPDDLKRVWYPELYPDDDAPVAFGGDDDDTPPTPAVVSVTEPAAAFKVGDKVRIKPKVNTVRHNLQAAREDRAVLEITRIDDSASLPVRARWHNHLGENNNFFDADELELVTSDDALMVDLAYVVALQAERDELVSVLRDLLSHPRAWTSSGECNYCIRPLKDHETDCPIARATKLVMPYVLPQPPAGGGSPTAPVDLDDDGEIDMGSAAFDGIGVKANTPQAFKGTFAATPSVVPNAIIERWIPAQELRAGDEIKRNDTWLVVAGGRAKRAPYYEIQADDMSVSNPALRRKHIETMERATWLTRRAA